MAVNMVAAWKKIRSAHDELGQGKFKPDLAALLAKCVSASDRSASIADSINKMNSGFIPYLKTIASNSGYAKSALDFTRSGIVNDLNTANAAFIFLFGDGSDWDRVEDACKTLTGVIKKSIPELDNIAKSLTDVRDKFAKDQVQEITKYANSRRDLEASKKKADAETWDLLKQVNQTIISYIKTAKQMKNDDLVDDLMGFLKILPEET
jgi:hypothetical protein